MNDALSPKCFIEFKNLTHALTGITISENRTLMLEGRLKTRMRDLKLSSYESYLELVKSDASERANFIDLVTTNETYFFRTPRVWDFIESRFLPKWFASHPRQILMIWSAAASSGDEAHSLGLICESFKDKHPGFAYQILGTDISNKMVARCKEGLYSGRAIEAFKKMRPELFDRYMRSASGETYQVSPEIKARLRFKQHNLLSALPGGERFDLILLRNVLIYFKTEEQIKVLSNASPKLADEGILVIGESESLAHIETDFKAVEPLVYRYEPASSNLRKTGS